MKNAINIVLSSLLASLLLPAGMYAQIERYFDQTLLVSQKAGTEAAVKSYFADIGSRSDTIYAYLYIPGQSPRLEFAMDKYDAMLKAADPDAEFVLISVNCPEKAAMWYNKRHGYEADYYICDEDMAYMDFLSFSTAVPAGGYALKVDKAGGRVLCCGAFAYSSKEYYDALVAYTGTQPFCTHSGDNSRLPLPRDVRHTDLSYEVHGVEMPDSLGAIFGVMSIASRDGLLLVADSFHDFGLCFSRSGDGTYGFVREFAPDESEKYMYFDVPDSLFGTATSLSYIMPLSVMFLPDGDLGMLIDLPKIVYDADDGFFYYNMPAILTRDAQTFEPDGVIRFDHVFDDMDDYYYNFFFASVLAGEQMMICMTKLGWPVLTKEEVAGQSQSDPFKAEYYDGSPCYVMVDGRTGSKTSRFGRLPDVFRRTLTGDYFLKGPSASFGSEFVYSDGVSGEICLADISAPDDVKRVYKAFDTGEPAEPDTSKFYTLDYMTDYENHYFRRTISSVKLRQDKIYLLVSIKPSAGSNYLSEVLYEYREVDRSSGEVVTSFMVTKQSEDESVLSATLSDDAVPRIAYLSEEDGDYSIKFVTGAGR